MENETSTESKFSQLVEAALCVLAYELEAGQQFTINMVHMQLARVIADMPASRAKETPGVVRALPCVHQRLLQAGTRVTALHMATVMITGPVVGG